MSLDLPFQGVSFLKDCFKAKKYPYQSKKLARAVFASNKEEDFSKLK